MPTPSEIQIAPLDFDTIKADLHKFLQNQSTLQDYNFEGSALSILLDILAYDAYYHGWYTNFAVNETFLQTAQIRNSVVAAAKQIGYVPRTTASSIALIDVEVGSVNTGEGTITISKYSPFTSTIQGKTYTFYNIEDYSASVNGANTVVFTGLEIYEGTKLTQTFNISSTSNTGTVLNLLNQNVDSRTISVVVKPSSNSTTTYAYNKAQSAITINSTSNVFFLFETSSGTYDIQFGDGILGRNLTVGQQVIIHYLDSRGAEGNGANTFTYGGNALGILSQTSNVVIDLNNVNIPSYGGTARETIDSIKKNAPNIYQTQGRIVTTTDVSSVLRAELNGLDSVSVWGGEDNDPPTYGKIFVAMKPVNATKFGPTQKQFILNNILKPKSLPIVDYELIDPDYIYVIVNTQVRYNTGLTSLTSENIRQNVADAILGYSDNYLGQFGSYFRYSQLSGVVDRAEPSVVSNLTTIELEKRITTNTSITSYELNFVNPIYQPDSSANVVSVSSKIGVQYFSHIDTTGLIRKNCFIENVGNTINVYRTDSTNSRLLTKENVGSVDFANGVITLSGFKPLNITTNFINELRVRAIPQDSDLIPSREQIVLIPQDGINVTVIEDSINRTRTTFNKITAGGRIGAGSF